MDTHSHSQAHFDGVVLHDPQSQVRTYDTLELDLHANVIKLFARYVYSDFTRYIFSGRINVGQRG
jgi:hypothetical protein